MIKLIVTAALTASLSFASLADEVLTSKDYIERSDTLATKIGDNDMVILFAAEQQRYAADMHFPYHPDPFLRYISGATQLETIYVLSKRDGTVNRMLFNKEADPLFEMWNGRIKSNQQMSEETGIRRVAGVEGFEQTAGFMLGRLAPDAVLWLELSDNAGMNGHGDRPGHRFAAKIKKLYPQIVVKDISGMLRTMREIKSENEVKVLRKAVEISAAGHVAGMLRAPTADREYQVEAAIEATYREMGAEGVGYESIVGAGENATILHYMTNQMAIPEGSLILVDSSAEYNGYSADITRTFPADGTFSDAQKDIYQIVYDAQEAAFALSKPDASYRDLSLAAYDVIAEGLLKLGLVTDKSRAQVGLFNYHGLGHGIGLDVHDPNPNASLQPGATYTIEPGVYINRRFVVGKPSFEALDDETRAKILKAIDKYNNIGVRIEDDILITEDGYENMSAGAPRSIEAIEALMAGK